MIVEGRLFLQLEEGVALAVVGAFAAGEFAPGEVSPFGEERVAVGLGVNQREMEPDRAGQRESFRVNAAAATDHDFTGQRFGEGEGFVDRGGDVDAGLSECAVAGDDDGMPTVSAGFGPALVTEAAENDGLPGGERVEMSDVLRESPGETSVATDDAVFGTGDNEVEEFGHDERGRREIRLEGARLPRGKSVLFLGASGRGMSASRVAFANGATLFRGR